MFFLSFSVAMWWKLEEGGVKTVSAEVSHIAMGGIPYPAHGPACLRLIGTHQQYTETGEWDKSEKYTTPFIVKLHSLSKWGFTFAGISGASLCALSSGSPYPVCWQSEALGSIRGERIWAI